MTEETERPGPGRPRDQEKRAAILNAARDLFYEHGVGAVAIETVASKAEVSKVTIYNQFRDKTKLFEEVVQREVKRLEEGFAALAPDTTPIEQRLNTIGLSLIYFLLQQKTAAFDRLLSLEAERYPDLAQKYFEQGPNAMRQWLSGIIQQAHDKGEIVVDNPILAAEDLAMLWQGFLPLEARLGVREITLQDIENRVQHGTRFFLKGVSKR